MVNSETEPFSDSSTQWIFNLKSIQVLKNQVSAKFFRIFTK